MAKISVIVPVHNAGKTLGRCVASVAAQDFADIELILVDDASSDDSRRQMQSFDAKHKNIKIVCLSSDGRGVSDARNTGISQSTGDFIAFLDDDDEYASGALTLLYRLLTDNPQADIAVGQFEKEIYIPGGDVLSPSDAIEYTLYQRPGYHPSACAKLYRRSLFDHELFVSGRRYEDLEFCPRIYSRARSVVFTGERVYNYIQRAGSFTNTWDESRTDALWAVDTIAEKFGQEHSGAARSRRFSAYFNIFNLAVANGCADIAGRCWHEIREMRKKLLFNRRARCRNRLAALVSMTGYRITRYISYAEFRYTRKNR